jgi:UDP-glucose 4-epimerase
VQILKAAGNPVPGQLVLLFGLGLIGSAIRNSLRRLEYDLLADIPFDWQDSRQLEAALGRVGSLCAAQGDPVLRLCLVWSAGRCGFYSTPEDIRCEDQSFQSILGFASSLRERLNTALFEFHFISSAGGLFEGQQVIGDSSMPSPRRPYGQLKLEQEQRLESMFRRDEITIYRPSSVYGPMARKSGHGLVNHLVGNARNGLVTVLDSHVMALRDYVFSGDIGNFIGRGLRFGGGAAGGAVHFLVSARCSSIFEVVKKVERVLKLRVRFRFDEQFGNHENITFNASVMPPGWRPVPLDVGIRQFMVVK